MEIEIRLANGRVVRTTLPKGAVMTSHQLKVLVQWAIEGRSADLLVE